MKAIDSLRRLFSAELSPRTIPTIGSVDRYALSSRIVVSGANDVVQIVRSTIEEAGVHDVLPRVMWEIREHGSSCVMVGTRCPRCDGGGRPSSPCGHVEVSLDRALVLSGPLVLFTRAGVFIRSLREIEAIVAGDPDAADVVRSMIESGGGVVEGWMDDPIRIDPDTVSTIGDPTYASSEGGTDADRRALVESWIVDLSRRSADLRGIPFVADGIQISWGSGS